MESGRGWLSISASNIFKLPTVLSVYAAHMFLHRFRLWCPTSAANMISTVAMTKDILSCWAGITMEPAGHRDIKKVTSTKKHQVSRLGKNTRWPGTIHGELQSILQHVNYYTFDLNPCSHDHHPDVCWHFTFAWAVGKSRFSQINSGVNQIPMWLLKDIVKRDPQVCCWILCVLHRNLFLVVTPHVCYY